MLQSSELLKKDLTELKALLREYEAELYLLKFKASTGQLDTTHKIKLVRRDIARVQTLINQKLQNKEQHPKVIKSKTPKTVLKPENKVESDAQTLGSSLGTSVLLSHSSLGATLNTTLAEAQAEEVTQNLQSLKAEEAVATDTGEAELLKPETNKVKEKESD